MNIEANKTADTLEIKLEGRLDTQTAPELDAYILENLAEATKLILDFSNLEYISSAGLRSLLVAHKAMEQKDGGSFVVAHPNEFVRDLFDTTGFSSILTIENNDEAK